MSAPGHLAKVPITVQTLKYKDVCNDWGNLIFEIGKCECVGEELPNQLGVPVLMPENGPRLSA